MIKAHANRARRPSARQTGLAAVLVASLIILPGCVVANLVGGMAASYERTGTSMIPADYIGLQGKSYAVVVTADRVVQADHPGLVERLMARINDRLANTAGASDYIPSTSLMRILYNRPYWPALPRGEVADMLGVERLVVIDLTEYQLHERGNQYVWDGSAAATVSVFETDTGLPDDPMYERSVGVTFPDVTGILQSELPLSGMTSELSRRLIDRISWLFYDHEEPNDIRY